MNDTKKSTVIVLLAVMIGVLFGLGGFTMFYAEGLSYFSANPEACKNCHIMQPQFDSWQKASHHTVAGCVDCHLPHDFINNRRKIHKIDSHFRYLVALLLFRIIRAESQVYGNVFFPAVAVQRRFGHAAD